MANKKGSTADELRRKKVMAKKTQEQISKSKQAEQKAGEANANAAKT